jgi:hypothetical protein
MIIDGEGFECAFNSSGSRLEIEACVDKVRKELLGIGH